MYYTGVGSRKTYDSVNQLLGNVAKELANRGIILRSGGARGSDTAFHNGSLKSFENQMPEIYIPKNGYNGLYKSPHARSSVYSLNDIDPELVAIATEIAARIHPKWSRCDEYARLLHIRNIFQVLGLDLKSPSQFLVCWASYTDNRKFTPEGGTRTAWKVAVENDLPCFNLKNRKQYDDFTRFKMFFL